MMRGFKLLALGLLAACFAHRAAAQTVNYYVVPDTTAVPAGLHGFTTGASIYYGPATLNFNICFYTGFGSSAPIVPTDYVSDNGYYSTFNFTVPAPTIQNVPPASFTNGTFSPLLYTVPSSVTRCIGGTQAGSTNTITLNYPTLTALSVGNLPDRNPDLKAILPTNLSLTGTNFLAQSGTSGNVPSAVNFIAGSASAGTVTYLAPTALISTIPSTISATAASVDVEVCNTAVYSYCSKRLTIKLQSLVADPGTLTATPNPATLPQAVSQTARFGPATPSVAGAPSGLVTFSDDTSATPTSLGSASLALDSTASFVSAPQQTFSPSTNLLKPIVADFNKDGIPDALFVESGSINSNATLHVLLGASPAGFGSDSTYSLGSVGSGFEVLGAAVADFNNDGYPDVVILAQAYNSSTGGAGAEQLYTFLGNGDGTLKSPFGSSPVLYGAQIVAGDFNKDGKQDIVIAGYLDTVEQGDDVGLQVLVGDGTGNFTLGPRQHQCRCLSKQRHRNLRLGRAACHRWRTRFHVLRRSAREGRPSLHPCHEHGLVLYPRNYRLHEPEHFSRHRLFQRTADICRRVHRGGRRRFQRGWVRRRGSSGLPDHPRPYRQRNRRVCCN